MRLYLSSFVRRWHTDAKLAPALQSNGHHQWGVGVLILTLHPNPSRALILAALTHDAGEMLTGDLPYTFKHRYADSAVVGAIGAAEEQARSEMLGFYAPVDEIERAWLVMCDRLESVLYVAVHDPDRLGHEDWKNLRAKIEGWAFLLGVAGPVVALLREVGA